MGENRLLVSIVVVAAILVTAGVGAAATPAPDPAPNPSPDPAPAVHAKPKPHVVTHVVTTAPPPVTPAPTPVVVTPAAPPPVVHTTPAKQAPVRKRVHAAKPKPQHVVVRSHPPAPTTTAAPILVSAGDQTSGRVTSAVRVQSFSSQWQRLLSWLLLVGSLIVLVCAALPALVPGAALVVEGRVQLALFGAALAAGGVSLMIVGRV